MQGSYFRRCASLFVVLLSWQELCSAERTLQQVSADAVGRRSPSPPPPSPPPPSPSLPAAPPPLSASTTATNATAAAVSVSNAAAASSAAYEKPTEAVNSQLPFNPAKFNPTVQSTDTGAVGAEATKAGVQPAAATETTAVSNAATTTAAFVKTSGTGFTLNGAKFYAAGSNGYLLGVISNGVQYGFTDAAVSSYFSGQHGQNLNAIRTWLFSNGNGQGVSTDTTNRAAQPSPGVFNETVLERFDRVVATAYYYNIKLIVTLSNYLPELGGAQWYVDSVIGGGVNPAYGSGGAITQWYTNANVIKAFQTYVSMLLNRVNIYTGRAYKNEPTIMAWELINEPEYTYNGDTAGDIVKTWVQTMSNYIRSIDTNHLISTGEEGFSTLAPPNGQTGGANSDGSCLPCDSDTNGAASANPFAIYHNFVNAGAKGVDFAGNLALPNINFATVHAYPQAFGIPFSNLGDYDNYTWINNYFIASRASLAQAAGKPIILEEFGTVPQGTQTLPGSTSYSNNYGTGIVQSPRSLVYGSMLASAAANGYAGAFPWEVYPFAPSGAAFSASTITFQWGQEGSAAIWAWGNYTACMIKGGTCTYARPVAEPNLISGTKYGYCNKGQNPPSPTSTCNPYLDCDVGFPGSSPPTNCSVAAQQAYNCSPGAFYQYVRCQATCNCKATAAG